MSYPKKITRDAVIACAMDLAEAHGLAELSMRMLAAELGVTPNALYRYVASKADLEFAMADEAGKLLLKALQDATRDKPVLSAMHDAALAYLRFALRHPQWYAVKMQHCKNDGSEPDSHADVWRFVMDLAATVPSRWQARDLALSLWAFLHGMVELARAGLLEGRQPEAALSAGLEVMLAGLATGLLTPVSAATP
jgi:AcrR family transcriptional regulator